jgi:hypothetical protein
MSKQIKSDGISEYANLKLFDLKILNEIRKRIKEIHTLRDDGVVVGVDVDTTLKRIESEYQNLLDRVNKLP